MDWFLPEDREGIDDLARRVQERQPRVED